MHKHNKHMERAIQLSEQNVKNGGGPFGAVIVKNNLIIAEGFNQVTALNDPTAHAEVVAIRNATQKINDFDLSGCIIYTSCEPCPMCLGAIYWSKLDAIYYGNTKQHASEIGFSDNFIYQEFEKSLDKRELPAQQLMPDKAHKAFQLWTDQENKIKY